MMNCYAQIIISFAKVQPIDRLFTYAVPEALQATVQVGMRVKVPFGQGAKFQIGYVVALTDTIEETGYKIKAISACIDPEPILSSEQLAMADFLVTHYHTTRAMAIDTVLPPGLTTAPFVKKQTTEVVYYKTKDVALYQSYTVQNLGKKQFAKQQAVLDYFHTQERVLEETLKGAGISLSSVQTLCKKGILEKVIEPVIITRDPIQTAAFQALNKEQADAFDAISERVEAGVYHNFLLEGVTGSGKTEVFLHAIKAVLEKGGGAIVLVPEIALTPQTFTRFKERFGNRVALTHSRMSPGQRQQLYAQVQAGEIDVVIGPRSALFMPMPNLKLIIIDEEHETTYKSDTTPKYHAVTIARKRMQQAQGVLVLASATPRVESYYEVEQGLLERLTLSKRATGATLPEVAIVDMRDELKTGNMQVVSRALHEAIKETLENGNQVMLLINRRGHSSFINCRNCGYVVKCKHCDIAMTYHLASKQLTCHHCGSGQPVPEVCPSCGSKHIRFFGNGTEKVEEYLNTYFHTYGIGRMDFDTTSGKEGHSKVLQAFRERDFNVLVGTQMIAKGHDFPNVALVGILAADMSLYMQDFRSEERTFQLLTQALGRAGRGAIAGKVVIQTYNPENHVLQQIKFFKQQAFYQETLAVRQVRGYPPYTHLFQLLISGKHEGQVIQAAQILAQYYTHYNKKKLFKIVGPCAATIGRIADDYRWKLVIIGEERDRTLLFGNYCLEKYLKREPNDSIKVNWDIDPYHML